MLDVDNGGVLRSLASMGHDSVEEHGRHGHSVVALFVSGHGPSKALRVMARSIDGARGIAAIENMKARPVVAFLQEARATVGTKRRTTDGHFMMVHAAMKSNMKGRIPALHRDTLKGKRMEAVCVEVNAAAVDITERGAEYAFATFTVVGKNYCEERTADIMDFINIEGMRTRHLLSIGHGRCAVRGAHAAQHWLHNIVEQRSQHHRPCGG